MKREVMENAGLSIFAEVGIVLFLLAFVLILVRVFVMKKEKADEMASIPLEDGSDFDGNEVSA